MYKYLTVEQAGPLLDVKVRRVRQMCESGELPGARKRQGVWGIPSSADPRLIRAEYPTVVGQHPDLDGVPPEKRNKALKKLGIVRTCDQRVAEHVRNGGKAEDAIAACAAENNISARTLFRWRRIFREQGLRGLVDTRGRNASGCSPISTGAFEYFTSLYLVPQQPSMRLCWQMLRYINKSENRDWTVPDYRRMCEYAKKHIPYPSAVLHREGLEAYSAKCGPHVLTDPDSVEPGECWVGDHHELNIMIRHRGKWERPWITAWEDMASRMIVGWHFSIQPNQTTVLRATKRGVEKYGPPRWVKIDNGRDYDSEMWTGETKMSRKRRKKLRAGYLDERMCAGLYGMLDITVSFAIPYNARAKRIERFFDTLDRQFCKMLPTYCGKDSGRKPEDLNVYLQTTEAIENAHDIESLAEVGGRYIEAYNNAVHTGEGMDGRTPAEVMASRTSRSMLEEGILDLLLRVWSGERVVGRNGIKFRGVWFGQYDHKLLMLQGKKVRVSYDPDDLRYLYVYDAATFKLIAVVEQARLMAYGGAVADDDLREAMRQQRHARRVAKQFRPAQRVANMALTDLAIEAVRDGGGTPSKHTPARQVVGSIHGVRTPLDGQAKAHKREQRVLKKAVGAESRELDMDFSLLRPPPKKHAGEKLEFPWEKHNG